MARENVSKEDSQMTCPLSFDDPCGVWPIVFDELSQYLPLKDVVCKSPTFGSSITIASLPIRFMPSSANLFKDTDHPFRWFLAPYVELYIIRVETLDAYKIAKPNIKAWVDARTNNMKRSSWLLLYVPIGTPAFLDTYNKVYARISNDFYLEKGGDRSVFLVLAKEYKIQSREVPPQHSASFVDFISRMRKCLVASFQQRTVLYDADIRRLDSFRGTPQLDFRQLFLVKESLALMYQMMQLPSEAFIQYEELEALLAFAPPGQLPDNDWPTVTSESTKSSSKQHSAVAADASNAQTDNSVIDWITPCQYGDDVLNYSINASRMKILKNKMGMAELHRYLFARQMFFLASLKNPINFAQKGCSFVSGAVSGLIGRLEKKSLSQDASLTTHTINVKKNQAYLWGICSAVQIVKTCQDQIASQTLKGHVFREFSQQLSEILHLALSMLKRLTTIWKECRNNSLSLAFDYTCWFNYSDLSAFIPPASSLSDAMRSEIENIFRNEDLLDIFSQKLRHAASFLRMDGDPPDVNLNEMGCVDLEASLSITLLKILENAELSAGRKRAAANAKLQSADVLLYIGAFHQASCFYSEILSSPSISSSSELGASKNVPNACFHWGDIRYTILRKLLLCSRVAENKLVYSYSALQILHPFILKTYVSTPAWTEALLNDITILSKDTVLSSPILGFPKMQLPLQSYFSIKIEFNNPDILQSESMKIVNDESVHVSTVRVKGGAVHRVLFKIFSTLPAPIQIDSIVATYHAFNLLESRAISGVNDGSVLLHDFDRDSTFECSLCTDIDNHLDTRKSIQINPGAQAVELSFRAPSTGEYGLVKVTMRMGSIVFQDVIECGTLNDLQNSCQKYQIISVEQPDHLFDLTVESAAFSPTGHSDDMYVSLSTLDGDQVTGLRMWAVPGLFNPDEETPRNLKNEHSFQEKAKEVSWSKQLQPPMRPPSNLQIPIVCEKVSQWTVNRNSSLSSANSSFSAVAKKEALGLEHLSFSALRGKSEIAVRIPFHTSLAVDTSSGANASERQRKNKKTSGIVVVSIVLQGVLLREGCTIAFDTRAECSIMVSEGLSVQCHPMGQYGSEFLLQCILHNCSSVPIVIKSYNLSFCGGENSSNGGMSFWKVLDAPHDISDEAAPKSAQDGLTLHPRNEYHAAFRIKDVSRANNENRLAQITFAYHRAICVNAQPWTKDRIFRTVRSIPQLSGISDASESVITLKCQIVSDAPDKHLLYLGRPVMINHKLRIEKLPGVIQRGEIQDALSIEVVVKPSENDGWIPIGQCKRVLRTTVLEESAEFAFQIEFVPVLVGDLTLPSLQVYHRLVKLEQEQSANPELHCFIQITPQNTTSYRCKGSDYVIE